MGDIADWLIGQDEFGDDYDEPEIWQDHKGNHWRLSDMESTHLVNILRLVVNRWAAALGVRPVPIRNPVAILNLDLDPEGLAKVARCAGVMAEALLDRLEAGEQLPGGYAVVWERVVNKIQECLRRSGQPLNQRLLSGSARLLKA